MNVNEMIDAARKQSGVSPVKQSRPPFWLRKKISAYFKRNGDRVSKYETPEALLQKILNRLGFPEAWDHHGVTRIGRSDCFVLEPYAKRDRADYELWLEEVTDSLSAELDCLVTWSSVSWHFPGWTYRILFYPPLGESHPTDEDWFDEVVEMQMRQRQCEVDGDVFEGCEEMGIPPRDYRDSTQSQ